MRSAPKLVPELRVRLRNEGDLKPQRRYVLYWMQSNRRLRFNFALQRAVEWARALEKPLVIYAPLCIDSKLSNDRLQRFALDAMVEHQDALEETQALYFPYVELEEGAHSGLIDALSKDACVVITDDFPASTVASDVDEAVRRLDVRLEQVDSNGLIPIAAAPRVFETAQAFRAWLTKNVASHLDGFPEREPLAFLKDVPRTRLSPKVLARWPAAPRHVLDGDVSSLKIDHGIAVAPIRGGERSARRRLLSFVREKLADYPRQRSNPAVDGSSRLSPYLNYGHLAVHEIIEEVFKGERTSGAKLRVRARPRRRSLFGLSIGAETFLDELVTWRELGFNFCGNHLVHDTYATTAPSWAQRTLAKHAKDPRPHLYSRAQLERGKTHDPYFNAAAHQLREEGWFHNQARRIWGKRILEWSPTPQKALATMTQIMNRWSLDGRSPSSVTGCGWTLGRYDRPQRSERAIFGTLRGPPANAARGPAARAYIERWAPAPATSPREARRSRR